MSALDEIVAQAREARTELTTVVLARIRETAPEPRHDDDPELAEGLRATITAVVDSLLDTLEQGRVTPRGLPFQALAQARRSARAGVSLQTVIRRYVAGHTAVSSFISAVSERVALDAERRDEALRIARDLQGCFLDQLIEAVTEEYADEAGRGQATTADRLADSARRLLMGETSTLPVEARYDLDAFHVGVVAAGVGGREIVRALAQRVDHTVLSVVTGQETNWAWLGARSKPDASRIAAQARELTHGLVKLALGEPAPGLTGFRITHRQACAACVVGRHTAEPVSRYQDVALIALAIENDQLGRSFAELFLDPLDCDAGRGEVMRDTLRAYFAAGQNAASAAAVLGVHPRTVGDRLRAIERQIGYPINERRAELETALRLEQVIGER